MVRSGPASLLLYALTPRCHTCFPLQPEDKHFQREGTPELLLCLPPVHPPQKGAGCLIPHAPQKAPGS